MLARRGATLRSVSIRGNIRCFYRMHPSYRSFVRLFVCQRRFLLSRVINDANDGERLERALRER